MKHSNDNWREPLGRLTSSPLPVICWAVDGQAIRDRVDVDFTIGGNAARHKYVDEGEVWVERRLAPSDMAAVILHEAVEYALMAGCSWPYGRAHDAANEPETALRTALAHAGDVVHDPVAVADDAFGRWLRTAKKCALRRASA